MRGFLMFVAILACVIGAYVFAPAVNGGLRLIWAFGVGFSVFMFADWLCRLVGITSID